MLGHHAELVLDRLELADGAAELLALVGVLQGAFEHGRQRARELGRNQPCLVQAQGLAATIAAGEASIMALEIDAF
jgi:hypothetical protein